MDRGAWCAIVHGVTKSRTQLNRLSTHARMAIPFPQQEWKGGSAPLIFDASPVSQISLLPT